MQVKVIAMVLCFAMVLSGIPAGAISLFGEASSSTEITPEQPVFDQKAKPYILGEVEDKRGETEKHFMMSDKSFTAVQYGEPVHYKDVNEKWADINNTLSDSSAKDAEDVDGVENTANSFKVKFAKKADSKKLVSITKGDYQLSWNLDGAANNKDAKLKNPDLSKQETGDDKFIKLKKLSSEVTYSSILPNTDLQYFINGSGVKENIIVNVKQDTYEYALNMKTKKLNLSLDDKGQVIATDIKDTANVIFTIPAPVMFDANNKQSNAVQYSLVQNDNKDYILKIVADPNWINSGNVQFPITIDPIVLSKNDQANIDSTFVSSSVNYDDTNFNSYSLLAVGTESYAYQNCRTLVKITTPILPKGSIVINSQYAVYQYEYGYYATSTPTKILNVNKITSAWNPNTVTWNNHPSYDAIISDNNPIEKTTGWVYYDVTKIVKSWYAGETNNGLLIKSNSEKPVGGSDATYSAKEY